jgi:hypothetical protein
MVPVDMYYQFPYSKFIRLCNFVTFYTREITKINRSESLTEEMILKEASTHLNELRLKSKKRTFNYREY